MHELSVLLEKKWRIKKFQYRTHRCVGRLILLVHRKELMGHEIPVNRRTSHKQVVPAFAHSNYYIWCILWTRSTCSFGLLCFCAKQLRDCLTKIEWFIVNNTKCYITTREAKIAFRGWERSCSSNRRLIFIFKYLWFVDTFQPLWPQQCIERYLSSFTYPVVVINNFETFIESPHS